MRRLALLVLLAAPILADDAVTAALHPVAGTNGGSGPFAYYAPVRIQLSEKPPEVLSKEPAYASGKPLYGAIQLGVHLPVARGNAFAQGDSPHKL